MTWLLIILIGLLGLALIYITLKQNRIQAQLQQSAGAVDGVQLIQQKLEYLDAQLKTGQEHSTNVFQKQLESLHQQLGDRLKDSHSLMNDSQRTVNERLDRAAKVIGDLQGKLGKLEEANEKLFTVGHDIRSLQEILKTPKLRGNLGEFLLSDLLAQILPKEHYQLQYSFKNNEKVDAVIKIGEQLVSVDAKFPLENFQRFMTACEESDKRQFKKTFIGDVRKHIDAIANKYIRPDEGTYDFALMYVPAENVYYEIIIKDELASGDHALTHRAMQKRVIPVSPNTLYVYLHTIALGLKGLQIEKTSQTILQGLARLNQDLGKINDVYNKVGRHLHNAQSAFDEGQNRLGKFSDRMNKLHGNTDQPDEKLETNNASDPKLKILRNTGN